MRDYSKASARFWTGQTGKWLKSLGRDYQVVGFYLFTCPTANMLGLYYLPLPTLIHEVGGLSTEGALKVLRSLSEGGYAHYDEHSETVWVVEMALHQIGERVTKKDNRHKAILKALEQFRFCPFFNEFLARYRVPFALGDVTPNPENTRAFEAPNKPLRSQEQEQEQEQEQNKEEGTGAARLVLAVQEPGKAELVDRVFEHWKQVHDHPRASLDDKRRKVIAKALASYSEADLCQAISGYLNSPHHMGQNERDTRYDDIELLLRDAKHIDAGLKLYAQPPRTGMSEKTRRIVDQTADWVPPEMRGARAAS